MNGTKNWWQSKTMWAGIVTLVIGILGSTGLADIGGEQDVIIEKIMNIITAVGSLIVLYGRVTAQSSITKKPPSATVGVLLLCAMLLVGGCIAPLSEPAQKNEFLYFNDRVQDWAERCQADPNECKDGLLNMAKEMSIWAAIVAGVDPNGGE